VLAKLSMATQDLFRERAKEARERAAATSDDLSRRNWLDIAKRFERLAEQPPQEPVWRVERVKSTKKKPR
jgi:hypothetical protein